jgi:hypothetical protein
MKTQSVTVKLLRHEGERLLGVNLNVTIQKGHKGHEDRNGKTRFLASVFVVFVHFPYCELAFRIEDIFQINFIIQETLSSFDNRSNIDHCA